MIDRRGRKNDARITITDLGRRLLQPGDEAELAASRQAAFLKPPLYGKLVERYRGAPVPAIKFLAGLLVREHKIVESVSEQAAEAFVASAKHAGFVSGNVIGEPRSSTVRPARETPAEPSTGDDTARAPSAKAVPIPDGFIAHTFPLRRDLTVTIPLPVELTKRDVERLHKWMDTLIIEEDE
jgi:hypothetical protein